MWLKDLYISCLLGTSSHAFSTMVSVRAESSAAGNGERREGFV